GRLRHGVGGTAGEIGHTRLFGEGPVCRCGNRGCLETIASSRAIAGLLSESRRQEVSPRDVLDLAKAGDSAAQRLVADAGRALGLAIANLCNLLNPEAVIVGGDLSGAGELLLDPLREATRRNGIPSAVSNLEITAGILGERAEMLGALALVMHEAERFQAPALIAE